MFVFWDNICLPEQAVKGNKEGIPERQILGFVGVNVTVHPPQDNWINWKYKLGCSFESSFNSLKRCFEAKVASREVIAHGSVNKFDTAQDILAVPICACVRHQFHEHAQAVWQSWQAINTKEDGKVDPLSYM